MDGPASSYSCLLIHICWKVEREARIEPPIQTEYLRSGGAMICLRNKALSTTVYYEYNTFLYKNTKAVVCDIKKNTASMC